MKKCEIIEIKTWGFDQAVAMFNSLNSDGMPLCDSDIIFSKMYSIANKNNSLQQINELWGELKKLSDSLESKKIADIDALFNQKMYFERAKNKGITAKTPGVRKYFTELNKDLLNNPEKLCMDLLNLAKIWDKISDFTIVKLLMKFDFNIKFFLASYLQRFNAEDVTEKLTEPMALCLLKLFTIMDALDIPYSSGKFKAFLVEKSLEKIVYEPILDICELFERHITQNWKYDEVFNALSECKENSLIYLNEYLFAKQKGFSFDIENTCTIEHIMPKSGKTKTFISGTSGFESETVFNDYVEKLGNKILLEERINKAIGSQCLGYKASGSKGYIQSSYPLAKHYAELYKDNKNYIWNRNDIDKSTEENSKRIADFIFGKK